MSVKNVVGKVVLATGLAGVLAGSVFALRVLPKGYTPVSQPTVTVTATPVPVQATVPVPTTQQTLTQTQAVSLVRSQGTAEFNSWTDLGIEGQFEEVCNGFDDGYTFGGMVVHLTTRQYVRFNGHDAGVLITAAILSTCPQHIDVISNL